MVSNFEFLEKDFPVLANFGELAEKYCYSDSNSCLMKLGMIGETIVNLMFTYDRIALPQDNTAVARIDTLVREGLLTRDLATILHGLRKVRNKAVHENYSSVTDSKNFLLMAYGMCEWFMQTYGDWSYTHTGEITNSELIDDELDFDVDSFNRQVITEPFNRAVLEEIAKNIDPESPREQGKTLIYAVNDDHADLIVSILKDIYTQYGVDNDAIMKITGSVANGNKKKIQEAIKRFKNEDYPSIVVTVDLLTTGIDVPSISTLVFMRRVKSRILFEQMLGRATRLCKEIHKTHFEIYDPVGVYDALEDVSTMKPVVANPATTFTQLLDSLQGMEDEAHVQNQINQVNICRNTL